MLSVEASMQQTLSRRERKKLETRQGLLAAAQVLFREKGYKGTFFNYFSSKEALLGEMAVWRVEQLRAALDVSQGAPASPVARIKLLLRLFHEQVAQDMKLVRRAFARHLAVPPPPPHGAQHQLFGLLTDLVGEAQACGEVRADVDAEVVSDLLRMFYFRRMVACRSDDGHPLPADHFEQVIDLLMDGLAGPEWRRA
jgi:AcrR family transcriptional regulator